MKKVIFVLVVITNILNAQVDLEKIMETTWYGSSYTRRNLVKDGEENMTVLMNNVSYYTSDNTFYADMKTTINLDGTKYSYKVRVKGSINTSDYVMTIAYSSFLSEDKLPNGLYWTYNTIYATLYSNADHSEYYLIQGTFASDGVIELSNYPY